MDKLMSRHNYRGIKALSKVMKDEDMAVQVHEI